jgi:hypothetical protein
MRTVPTAETAIQKAMRLILLQKDTESALLKLSKTIANLKGQFRRQHKKSCSIQEDWVFAEEPQVG